MAYYEVLYRALGFMWGCGQDLSDCGCGLVIVNMVLKLFGAMRFGDFCAIALQLTLFGTSVTHVPRVWEFCLTPATRNSDWKFELEVSLYVEPRNLDGWKADWGCRM
jgi:hypothetical protein